MILVDSHVLLWLLTDSPRLGRRTRTALASATAVQVSSVTIAELLLESMKGKLSVPDDLVQLLPTQGLSLLSLTADHASRLSEFTEFVEHDPFDRLLLAQALHEGLEFCTADSRLLALDRPWITDAAE